jgi:hypothetical protein
MRNGGIEYLTGGTAFPTRIGSHTGSRLHDAGGGSWSDGVHKFLSDLMQNKESQPGLYRFKIRAGAFAGKGKHAVDAVKMTYEFGNAGSQDMHSVTIDAPLDQPRDYEWSMYLHPPKVAGARLNTLTWNGTPFVSKFPSLSGVVLIDPEIEKLRREILQSISQLTREKEKSRINGDQAKVTELENQLIQENVKRFEEYKKLIRSFADAKRPVQIYNPEIPLDDIPRLWIESWEVEGPIVEWPPQGRKKLFFDGDGDTRPLDQKYIREVFARFLPRAYRRPVEPVEVDAVVSWVLKAKEEGKLSGLEAVKKGVKAVLCSPDFLFIREPNADAGKSRLLNDYELASRLSFFLWSSMPDDELFQLAEQKKLHEPAVLKAQVQRMLKDPKGMGFVRDFTGQWLKVREFGKTGTDTRQYPTYTAALKKATWQEPFEFFKYILDHDLPVDKFVDSDFVVINDILAKHYGIEGVQFEGDKFQRVDIQSRHHRGGVLGMAGVLTYLTDGFRTLPVRRAAYVLDTLWNEPPKPPPPNAGDLPMVKDKQTVRERLLQHKTVEMCASCHARIDPFGIALENYDAIGAWRERQTGEGFRGDKGSPLLDVSGALPDKTKKEPEWRKFKDLNEYKRALLAEKDHFVQGFTEKMLTYALGRPASRSTDRELISGVVEKLKQDDYRIQSLVQAIVASEAFKTK